MSSEPRTLADLETIFRREAKDEQRNPYFWSQAEVYEFANAAQIDASRRSRLLVDASTAEICRLAFRVGVPLVRHDARIIALRRVVIQGQSLPLEWIPLARMDRLYLGWESATTNIPTAYIPDHTTGYLRLYPSPLQAGTLLLSVVREPLSLMEKPDDEPEFARRYRRALVDGMLALAWRKQDADTFDQNKADRAEALFTREFGPPVSARNERWAFEGATFPDTLA